jgi:hypothetical protein
MILGVLLGVAGTSLLLATESPCPTGPTGFPCLWNSWVAMCKTHDDNTYDLHEIELWKKVKSRFHEVEKSVDKGYGLNL